MKSWKVMLVAGVAAVMSMAFISASMAENNTLKEVKLYEIEKKEVLVEAYPFLKKAIDEVIANDKQAGEEAGDAATVFASKLSYPALKKTVLVVRYEGAVYCGNLGCQTNVYIDEGKGYYEALDVVTEKPTYISTCKGLSLFLTTSTGIAEWPLKGKAFEFGKSYPDAKSLPACK